MKEKLYSNTRDLIAQIQNGNTDAFQQFIERYKRLVFHIVFRTISNQTDQEDICQDIFIKIYQNLSNFRFESKLSTWIAKIAYNTCLNYLKKKKIPLFSDIASDSKVFEESVADESSFESSFENRDILLCIQEEICHLPVPFRTAITLYHIENMSYNEISQVMALPEGTVKSHLFRARKILRKKLLINYKEEELWIQNT